MSRAVQGGGAGGQLLSPGKLFFSNIVFDLDGLFLVHILVRDLKN